MNITRGYHIKVDGLLEMTKSCVVLGTIFDHYLRFQRTVGEKSPEVSQRMGTKMRPTKTGMEVWPPRCLLDFGSVDSHSKI